MKDPVGFTNKQLELNHLPQPAVRWGGGGYLMPLSSKRIALLGRVDNGADALEGLHVGDTLTVKLDKNRGVPVAIERFIEQWGGENPIIQIGVLARVKMGDLLLFRSIKSDYFVAYYGLNPLIPVTAISNPVVGPHRVLNGFGLWGKLVLVRGDDGWNIALWRQISGELRPTSVMYAYGD